MWKKIRLEVFAPRAILWRKQKQVQRQLESSPPILSQYVTEGALPQHPNLTTAQLPDQNLGKMLSNKYGQKQGAGRRELRREMHSFALNHGHSSFKSSQKVLHILTT